MVGISRKDAPEPEGPTLEQRLSEAREKAQTARAHLDGLTARLHKAVEEARYGDADAIQAELPAAENAHTIAAAEQHAIEFALEHLDRERQAREAKIQAEKRRQQAQANLGRAAEAERALMDDLLAVRAEIIAGLDAIRDAVARGQALEGQVRQQRAAQQQARIDAGEQQGIGHVAAPNNVSTLIDQSPALLALVRDHPLVGR